MWLSRCRCQVRSEQQAHNLCITLLSIIVITIKTTTAAATTPADD